MKKKSPTGLLNISRKLMFKDAFAGRIHWDGESGRAAAMQEDKRGLQSLQKARKQQLESFTAG